MVQESDPSILHSTVCPYPRTPISAVFPVSFADPFLGQVRRPVKNRIGSGEVALSVSHFLKKPMALNSRKKQGMVMSAYNPNIRETETGGSPEPAGQPN